MNYTDTQKSISSAAACACDGSATTPMVLALGMTFAVSSMSLAWIIPALAG